MHPILPPLVEVFVRSVVGGGAEATNDPITEAEILAVFKLPSFSSDTKTVSFLSLKAQKLLRESFETVLDYIYILTIFRPDKILGRFQVINNSQFEIAWWRNLCKLDTVEEITCIFVHLSPPTPKQWALIIYLILILNLMLFF